MRVHAAGPTLSLGRLFWAFARLRMRERLEYRGAYLTGMLAQMIGYGADYAILAVLLHRFDSIAGWTWPQVVFLFSLEMFTYALGASFVYSGMFELEEMVRDGSFDVILAKPLDPLWHLVARKYNPGYLAHLLLSGGFLGWSLLQLEVAWTWPSVVYLAGAIIGGACLQAAALIGLGTLSFFIVRTSAAFYIYTTLKELIAYPAAVYGLAAQVLLTVIVPLAFINYYPASFLLGKPAALIPGTALLAAPLVGPAALYLACRYFAWGVGRYQGAGG